MIVGFQATRCDSAGFHPKLRPWGRGVLASSGLDQTGFEKPRRRLVERLRSAGIDDPRVLAVFDRVPRHVLVPEALRANAYRDVALPIGEGQTISAPGVVAAMTQALALTGSERVLEVGTGSGYQAAILAGLAARVISIERVPRLAAHARTALDRLGVSNVVVHLGDGSAGRPAEAPYDAIVVTAGGPDVPSPLLDQLATDGRLVGPFGPRGAQDLVLVRRRAGGFERASLGRCRFVDLLGAHGWSG